ncbi:hypothetical protein [Rhodococcus sp. NPDC058521]|uniref:hypothetical protein n=1 Tax=Rhodococcus sp. NPDC058521 TaxID=3346536 RepID=UPI003653C429
MATALATTGIATAGAAPSGSLGEGPDLTIAPAGQNTCAVQVTNEGDADAEGVTLHAPILYGSRDLGTLAPGESVSASLAGPFNCGFYPYIFYLVTTSGETDWSDNSVLVKASY